MKSFGIVGHKAQDTGHKRQQKKEQVLAGICQTSDIRGPTRWHAVCILVFCLLCLVPPAWAENVELPQIVVTPYRYSESLNRTSGDVTLITSSDIKGTQADNITDVLRSVPGISVRDFYGNGTTASVDMAGFGEQGALNVLVLVDGRRINEVDLGGVDWNLIPLEDVERIEVIRGGSGAVLYGDNASSGVINIITKKGSGQPKMNLETAYGSYGLNKEKLALKGLFDNKLSYWFSGGRESTKGYRQNTFNRAGDFSSRLEYRLTDETSVHLDSGYHASSYGMSSALFQHQIDEYGREWAHYVNDHANNKDYYFVIGANSTVLGPGTLAVDLDYRKKDTDSYFLSSHNDTRKNRIETLGLTPKYTLTGSVANHDNKFITGLDLYRVFFQSRNYLYSNDGQLKNYSNIRKDSAAGYLQDELSLTQKLVAVGGYRYETARYSFAYHDFTAANPDRDARERPDMQAFNSGLVYNYQDDSSLFFNVDRSFRFPEVDEFVGQYDINFHQFLNTELKPQSAVNYQTGVRHKFSDSLKGGLTFFRMNVQDEIYYNPSGGIYGYGQNENYARTVHEGASSSLEVKLNERVTSFGNYSLTRAYFDGGVYNRDTIPMVPRHKVSAGFKFLLAHDLSLNVTDTYVGKRYFLNDQANTQSQLNGYMVVDTGLVWHVKNITASFGINNVFDRQYAEYAGYASDSTNGFLMDKFYYPSPGRNYNFKIEYTF